MQYSLYQSMLRVMLLVVLCVLLFDGGFFHPITKQLSDNTFMYLSSVGTGVFASVQQNELNTLTAQLTQRQRELDAREAALSEREIKSRSFNNSDDQDYSTYILTIVLFILTVLIVLNFAMDWIRVKPPHHEESMA